MIKCSLYIAFSAAAYDLLLLAFPNIEYPELMLRFGLIYLIRGLDNKSPICGFSVVSMLGII